MSDSCPHLVTGDEGTQHCSLAEVRYEPVPMAWLKRGKRYLEGVPLSQTINDGEPYVGDHLDPEDEPLYRRVVR